MGGNLATRRLSKGERAVAIKNGETKKDMGSLCDYGIKKKFKTKALEISIVIVIRHSASFFEFFFYFCIL